MSWITLINSEFSITTGDGSVFSPQWLNATRQTSYNIKEFIFPNVAGSLVERREPKGVKYNLEVHFQGENHIDISNAFEIAARDSRAWKVAHPFYGEILVQPNQLVFDQKKYNVTKITGTLLETIDFDGIKSDISNVDAIEAATISLNDNAAEQLEILDYSAGQATVFGAQNDNAFERFKKAVTTNSQINELTNAYNEANTAINNLTIAPVIAMRKVQNVLTLPYTWELSLQIRFNALKAEFEALFQNLGIYRDVSSKKYLEGQTTSLMAAICNTAAQPLPGDYKTRTDVENTIEEVISLNNTLIENFDTLSDFDYTPKQEVFNELDAIVNFTISKLFEIAIGAQQERTFILTEDSNIINLTHRFIGLDSEDLNLDDFIEINDIGLNEILEVKKGRKILYYV